MRLPTGTSEFEVRGGSLCGVAKDNDASVNNIDKL